jgi:hypothetical protein
MCWHSFRDLGQFAYATGVSAANFTMAPEGVVVDNHFVRLFLPL